MNDWGKAIAVILIFMVIMTNMVFSISAKSVQDNWPVYRCNPLMMPFAASFAPEGSNVTTEENFSYCIQETISNFAPIVTQPFNYVQTATMDLLDSITESNKSTTEQQSWLKSATGGILEELYAVFAGVIVEFNVLFIKIVDIQHKLTGVITSVLYITTAVQYAFESMWAGIPGKLIKDFSKMKV